MNTLTSPKTTHFIMLLIVIFVILIAIQDRYLNHQWKEESKLQWEIQRKIFLRQSHEALASQRVQLESIYSSLQSDITSEFVLSFIRDRLGLGEAKASSNFTIKRAEYFDYVDVSLRIEKPWPELHRMLKKVSEELDGSSLVSISSIHLDQLENGVAAELNLIFGRHRVE